MIHSFTVTFGATYLTGMVTGVPSYETFSLIKNNNLHQSIFISLKTTKNHFKNSNLKTSYLDCHGVITPSSGPPTNTNFFNLKKFSL
jgi:hypothetical protein